MTEPLLALVMMHPRI